MKESLSNWLKEHAPHVTMRVNDPVMSIGAATRIVGLSESALRKYEAAGLIIYNRTASRRRLLTMEDIERIRIIQQLIKGRGLNLEGILRLWALIPCWELKECASEYKQNCPAMIESERPCWILMQNKGCAGSPNCLECEVYRFSAYCTEDLKSLVRGIFEAEKPELKKRWRAKTAG